MSIASGLLSFSLEAGFKVPTATAAEVDCLSQEDRVNVLGNIQPKYTPQEAVIKVKEILQAMQAREQDFAEVFENFMNKFSDSKAVHKDKIDIIDPFWSKFTEQRKSTKSTSMARLKELTIHKKATEVIMKDEFQKHIMRSRNAAQGFGRLIELCDEYIDTQNHNMATCLLDSLLASHLLNLKSTIDLYMPSEKETASSHVSLKQDEIEKYYTQDSRLAALSQLYYIVDYVRPIDILIKAGLQPEAIEWDFAGKIQQYVKGEVTLNDPGTFLIDGFLYQKGMEKAKKSLSMLKLMAMLNGKMDTGGVLNADIDVAPLLPKEKEEANSYYNILYKIHRSRVELYISQVKKDKEKLEKIRKSTQFLNTALRGDSKYALTYRSVESHPSEQIQAKKKQKRSKKRRRIENQ